MSQGLLTLPSEETLRQVEQKLGAHSSWEQDAYLRIRIQNLTEDEKHVTLQIDEIYVGKKPELSGAEGRIYGLTQDGRVASTVLTFMVGYSNLR